MVYLDATTQAAGATKIVVGSHQNGLILHPPTADDRTDASRGADNVRLGGSISTDVAEQQGPIIEPAMAVGDAVVLSPFVVHSVRSPRFRCALEHAAAPTAPPTGSL
jgi:ectoine hydroxylase-related dioxygenase (phytanoyl-CoA dioxygenase family)